MMVKQSEFTCNVFHALLYDKKTFTYLSSQEIISQATGKVRGIILLHWYMRIELNIHANLNRLDRHDMTLYVSRTL